MWLVNDGKSGGIMASYDAILKWSYQKERNGQLKFTSDHERANFVQTVKRNLESQYFTKSGDRNVPPYGHKRYFFIDIATHKVKKGNIFARIEKALTKDVEVIVNKELLKKEITLTIG